MPNNGFCCPVTSRSRKCGTNIQDRWPPHADDGPMDNTKHAVAATGLLGAAMRAEESARDDALFHDPFAERLAGDDGRRLLAESSSETGQPSAPIVVRTRLFDEALLSAHADGVSQVVIVAAGMDARSFRLPWADGVTVYEVDQPQVIAIKEERLAGRGRAANACRSASTSLTTGRKRFSRRDSTPRHPPSGRLRGCCSTSKRRMSIGCSRGWTHYRRPARCCCTTSSARHCSKRRFCRTLSSSWKSLAHHGFSAATHRLSLLETTAGQPPSPTWPYRATNGNVGHPRRFRLMYPTHHAAILSRQPRPEP